MVVFAAAGWGLWWGEGEGLELKRRRRRALLM